MKKIKLTNQLALNKETIAKLNSNDMNNINGGIGFTSIFHCNSTIRHTTCGGGNTTITI